jgi:soluble lytic murein transglycosylase-like protein
MTPLERGSFRALIRRPLVQLVLIAAATVQVVAVQQTRGGAVAEGGVAVSVAPVVVTPEGRSVGEIVAQYRAEGYPLSLDLAEEIHDAAEAHGIDPEIAFGLVRAESSFRNQATSTVGAVGLTQLMPSTARWLEPGTTRSDLRDPEKNLQLGFRYLRQLIDKYQGDVDLALVAYNRGPGTVDRALKRGRNPDNGYAAFVKGQKDHGHELFTKD